MKKIITLLMAIATGMSTASAFIKKDTSIIEFNDKASKNNVKVITKNKIIEFPKVLTINNILKAIGVDTSERNKAIVLISKSKNINDTLLVLSKEGEKIKIITKQSLFKKDTLINPKINKNEVDIFNNGGSEPAKDEIMTYEENDTYNESPNEIPQKPYKYFNNNDFGLYLGLNNFINNSPSQPSQMYGLRAWPSRYIALSFRRNETLIYGKHADLAFSYGPEISWSNFMFENSHVITYTNDQVAFVNAVKETQKSKLVLPSFNLPIMFNIGFKESKFKLGIGGYIGYRLGGYSRIKYGDGIKIKDHANFGMNNFIYGLTTEFGRKNGFTIFFRYNLNNTFNSNQINGQNLQAFSAGFRL